MNCLNFLKSEEVPYEFFNKKQIKEIRKAERYFSSLEHAALNHKVEIKNDKAINALAKATVILSEKYTKEIIKKRIEERGHDVPMSVDWARAQRTASFITDHYLHGHRAASEYDLKEAVRLLGTISLYSRIVEDDEKEYQEIKKIVPSLNRKEFIEEKEKRIKTLNSYKF